MQHKIWVNKSANNMRHFYSRIEKKIRKENESPMECKDCKCKKRIKYKRGT